MNILLLFLSHFFIFVLFLFSISSNSWGVDLGNGSDGACDVQGILTTQINSSKRNYNCTELTINSDLNLFRGDQVGKQGEPLIIRVWGNVTLDSGRVIDLSGENGFSGTTSTGSLSGGGGGGGGSRGGNGTVVDGENGQGTGGGLKGVFVSKAGASSFGGGGGGGSYKTTSATSALDGDSGLGSVNSTGGVNGIVYGSENNFESEFLGGSGGAGGGGGTDSSSSGHQGSSGGGGGGALLIVAGGDLTINGTIKSNGGDGGGVNNMTLQSGGGGGGSGGAIWLVARGRIILGGTGVIEAIGGVGGANSSGGLSGSGGNGGNGRIRLDDADGMIENSGTINSGAISNVSHVTMNSMYSSGREFKSAISCGRMTLEDKKNQERTFFSYGISFILGFFCLNFLKKKMAI